MGQKAVSFFLCVCVKVESGNSGNGEALRWVTAAVNFFKKNKK